MLQTITLFYLGGSIFLLLLPIILRKHYFFQINFSLFFDIPMILLIMHFCGGVTSGIGILLVIVIAAQSLFVTKKWSLFGAAIAIIGLFLEQTYNVLYSHASTQTYTQIGLLGIMILLCTLSINWLSARIHRHQRSLYEKEIALNISQQMNASIVAAMHEGVIILDDHDHVQLMNSASYQLLHLQQEKIFVSLTDFPDIFQATYRKWKNKKKEASHSIESHNHDLRLRFQSLSENVPTASTLIFIYDATQEKKRAQNLKLASLGHLTANIAHELRNPLGAISHAAQLLLESKQWDPVEKKLIHIVHTQSMRINTIIQNVIALSSRKRPNVVTLNLVTWIKDFIHAYLPTENLQPVITLHCPYDHINVQVDPAQLAQVLFILFENGLRYSQRRTGRSTLTITLQAHAHSRLVCIDIADDGPGVSHDDSHHIFEPFYTTESTGTGLGLYIAKEISLLNGFHLEYIPQQTIGATFRVSIPIEKVLT